MTGNDRQRTRARLGSTMAWCRPTREAARPIARVGVIVANALLFLLGMGTPVGAQSRDAQSPRDAVLEILFAENDATVQRRLPRVADELRTWHPLDAAGFRLAAIWREEGLPIELGQGDTLFVTAAEALGFYDGGNADDLLPVVVSHERREGDYAVVRTEGLLDGDAVLLMTFRLMLEDGIWKLMGLTQANLEDDEWVVDDVRLTDPVWWETTRVFARSDGQWQAKQLLGELKDALDTYRELYGTFPATLEALNAPRTGGAPTAEHADLFQMQCPPGPCTRDSLQLVYEPLPADTGDGFDYYSVLAFRLFPGEEPYLLAHLDPLFGPMDPDESALDRMLDMDPLSQLGRIGLPREASQSEVAAFQAMAQDALSTRFLAYAYAGEYVRAATEAEEYLRRGYERYGLDHPGLASTLMSLAAVYALTGEPQRVEELMQEAIKLASAPEWRVESQLAELEGSLGTFYLQLGNASAARPLLERAAERLEDVAAENADHQLDQLLTPVTAYISLGTLYLQQAEFDKAERVLSRLLWLLPDSYLDSERHPLLPQVRQSLAEVMLRQGRLAEADSMLREALPYQEPLDPDYGMASMTPVEIARLLALWAEVYRQRDQLSEAESLHERVVAINEQLYGDDHVNLFGPLVDLMEIRIEAGRTREVEEVLDRIVPLMERQIQLNFAFMSEGERLAFTGQLASFYDLVFDHLSREATRNPQYVGRFYDLVLRRKGLVATTMRQLRQEVEESSDPSVRELLNELVEARSRLATLRLRAEYAPSATSKTEASPATPATTEVEELDRQVLALEKQLVRGRSEAKGQASNDGLSWRDVSRTLQPGDAAVEFVRLRDPGNLEAPGTGRYLALVLVGDNPAGPVLVDLGATGSIEAVAVSDQQRIAQTRGLGGIGPGDAQQVGDLVWRPLVAALSGAQRVFVAPDGILSQVNFNLLTDGSGNLLMDELDLRLVTSTRRLLEQSSAAGSEVVLIGDPDYLLTEAPGSLPAPVTGAGVRSHDLRSAGLDRLPQTRTEVLQIQQLLQERWSTSVYADEKATESLLKGVVNPRVLHIATHGFFLPDQQKAAAGAGGEDPMLRSGLYLAGAGRTLQGQVLGEEDGILTAREAMNLQLQGTEIVALSACETALGSITVGEGVFGLQRALQIAGAETVLMSLWAVPDAETAELMTLFYQGWRDGLEPARALRAAQIEMRERVRGRYGEDRPFYWGAFVLLQ